MEPLEITELKDSILLYLFDRANGGISLSEIYYDLNPGNVPKGVVHDYLEDMVINKFIACPAVSSGGRNLYHITERGKRRLKERGYTKVLGVESEKTKQIKFIRSNS
jgi:DNA-binding PadR family transcriptional regulator